MIEGNGEFKWSTLKYYKGEWKNNCIDGFGVFTEDDKEYLGYFTKNVKNGIEANYYIDSYIFMVAQWKEDKLCDGLSLVIDKNNKESIVLIKDNITAKKFSDDEIYLQKVTESEEYKTLKQFYNEKILSGYYCNL